MHISLGYCFASQKNTYKYVSGRAEPQPPLIFFCGRQRLAPPFMLALRELCIAQRVLPSSAVFLHRLLRFVLGSTTFA